MIRTAVQLQAFCDISSKFQVILEFQKNNALLKNNNNLGVDNWFCVLCIEYTMFELETYETKSIDNFSKELSQEAITSDT